MKRRQFLIPLLLISAALVASRSLAQWTNYQAADLVLGQKDYLTSWHGAGRDSLYAPVDVAIDPLTRKLFVADIANNRILRFRSVDSLVTGDSAEAVIGQPDFTSNVGATGPALLNFPTAIAFDPSGRLWVADADNNRVVWFNNAGSRSSSPSADGVLGQPDFMSNAPGLARDSMNYVRGIAIDAEGHLWVSDQSNNRVLRFDNAASKPNGANADGVLGQPNFTTWRDTTSPSSLRVPRGLVVDRHGTLFVADSWNDRVLRFDSAATKANGADADGALGEPDFVTDTGVTSRSGMNNPLGVELDPSGRLYVSEDYGNRVIWFNDAASRPNGANADGVLGQPDFTTNTGVTTQRGTHEPWGICIDSARNTLWVADASNNRVLRFTAVSPLTGVQSPAFMPSRFALSQNFPNPFNPTTTIEYTIGGVVALSGARLSGVGGPAPMSVRLVVYDILGREVTTLVNERKAPGSYQVNFSGAGLSSGVYFYRITAGSFAETRRMVLLK